MIETAGAFADAPAIAAFPCVDGLFIGPGDLWLARGRGIFTDGKEDIADLEIVAKAAKGAGKLFAAAGPTRHYAQQAADLGAAFVAEGVNSPP
jgi:2-keto-3-deoxy-L-rhamnonate aldolase RhmA